MSPQRVNTLRYASLALSWAFGVISMSVGINALVKSNQQKSFVKSHSPEGVSVKINTDDILRCGIVLTVVAGNIASMSSNTALVLYFRPRFTNILRWSGAIILFLTTWLFACLVAFDVIARNRQAKVTATLAGVPLPASIVAAQQSALGVSPVYWDQDYLHLVAIIPWFAVLFGITSGAGFILFPKQSETVASTTPLSAPIPAAAEEDEKKEKESEKEVVEMREGETV